MQLILVVVVIFVPQSVTMFLDKKVEVDLDKVVIEMPTDEASPTIELKAGELPNLKDSETAVGESASKDAEKEALEEQKRVDALFKK
jgi:hypothetical protein